MAQGSNEWLGEATFAPRAPIAAGHFGTWTVRYRTGTSGIDEGGRIRLCWRSVSDWPAPQFERPGEANYATVRSSAASAITPLVGSEGVRPWSKTLTLRVSEEALAPGDEVVLVLGDTSFGSPGMRAQTHPEQPFRFKVQIDPFGTGVWEHLTDLELQIIGGPAERLYVVVPSDAVLGEPSWIQVRALDAWGNPDPSYRGTVNIETEGIDGLPEWYTFNGGDSGVHRFEGVQFTTSGVMRIEVSDDEIAATATSNPVRIHEYEPGARTFWADLHGQSQETVGTGTAEGLFQYARDIAAVDAAAHQGNDFQITDEFWRQLSRLAERYNEPGRFVTLHGYEWSGLTPAGGDHNVYFKKPEPPHRSSHTQIQDDGDPADDRYPITRLYEEFKGRDDVIIVPHIGGRRADIRWHEPDLEPVIEIASQWGRFEWFAREAIERGYEVGFIGGSDDHSARQGWSSPTLAHHGVRGGLTGWIAPSLTRDALWDALKGRSVYGTSGPRILLDVDVSGHPIGASGSVPAGTRPEINLSIHGTAPLDSVEIRRGLDTVHTWRHEQALDPDRPIRLRIAWRGARNRGRSRALDWSGELRVWNGRIRSAENYAIDNPHDGVQYRDPGLVRWSSHTCGDWDGVDVEIDGTPETLVDVRAASVVLRFTLAEIAATDLRHAGPLLEQEIVVRPLGREPGPLDLSRTWKDEDVGPGRHPYWIWVTQDDGELAWSSPVYLTIEE